MANPQKENGYTPIANEILDELFSRRFNATQLDIILCVMRYTYGFSRKSHKFSLVFLSNAINSEKRNIQRELSYLIESKVLILKKEATFNTPRELSFNKNYETWDTLKSLEAKKKSTGGGLVTSTDGENVTSTGGELTTQDKQDLKQDLKQKYCAFFESLWNIYPEKKGKGQVSDTQKKKLFKIGHETLSKCIYRYIEDKPAWKKWQNGSTFFNSGYIDYLDENYKKDLQQDEIQESGGTY